MKKKVLSLFLTGALLLSCACGGANNAPAEDPDKAAADAGDLYEADSDGDGIVSMSEFLGSLSMTVNGTDGKMSITRSQSVGKPMGDPGTWTIFIYLCGTDLESQNGFATGDVIQMLEAEPNDNVTFVIQTGGTDEWQNDLYNSSSGERWVLKNQDMEMVDQTDLCDMGDPNTLADFLAWGIDNYPAEKMGLIFWDHGSGSLNGACFDEMYELDSLSLPEINQALSSVYQYMTDQFEFIGFDCCLMGTLETANVLATYARYFYGSQETLPGTGWDYTSIGTYLAEHPECNGAQLGQVVTDSFYDECAAIEQESGCTFTIVDCSLVDELTMAFNDYAKELYEAAQNDLSGVVRGIVYADNFGGNNRSEGFTNMVDLGGIIDNCSTYANGTSVLSALSDCIVYNRNGSTHSGASGLSIYYPLEIQGSNEIDIFSDVCTSPYYLSLVDMIAKGYSEDGYDNGGLFDEDGNWSSEDLDSGYDDSYFEYEESDGESKLITFAVPPSLDEDGIFGFVLDENGLEYAASVTAYVYLDIDDAMVELGETDDVKGDWSTGEFYDNFDGYWLGLSDGSLLPTYIADWGDDYTVLTTPIKLNGRRTNLRVRQYNDYSIVVEGAWDGISDTGSASREIIQLAAGDEIVPIYYLDDDTEFDGDPYIWKNDLNDMSYNTLPAGDYYYGFGIDDVYGDYYISDFTVFTVDEDGGITYMPLDEV